MRLIIDIPEEEYNSGTLVNYFGCYSEKLDEVIYNAPTVEMAEDCVKREDVKKFLYERLDRLNDDELYDIFSKIIDDMYNELPSVTPQTRWIPCNERSPKENEYIGNVCKYYLIQDEYGDMHVAHLSNVGWIPMDSLKAIGNEIIAWKELPQSYKAESEVKE